MLAVVAAGFGPSFRQGATPDGQPLPVHLLVHAGLMTLWYLVFLAQALLVSRGSLGLHRRLGITSLLLAAGVAVSGAQVLLAGVPRWQAQGLLETPERVELAVRFVLEGLASLLPFVVLVGLAVARRRDPASHKRLMFWAFVWTLGPALSASRPFGRFLDGLVAPHLPFFPFDLLWLAALLAYDWATLGRLHPVSWLGFLLLAFYFLFATGWIVDIPVLQAWLRGYLGLPPAS